MTLPSRIASEQEPSAAEDAAVAVSLSISRRMKSIGGLRLLHARMNWEKLFSSANPPGAEMPDVAKGRLTRDSRRRWELARKARRGATPAFRLQKAIQGR